MDFLKGENCKIDFVTNTLNIGDEEIKLTAIIGQRWCRQIQTIEEIVLLKESLNIIPATMFIGNSKGSEGETWMLEHKELDPSIHIARAVYKG